MKNLKTCILALSALILGSPSFSSAYLELGLNWFNYSLDSTLPGDTRTNYYAVGPKIFLGISLLDWMVLEGHGSYHKTSRSESKTETGSAELVDYGGGFRFHFLSDIQVGLGYSETQIQNLNMDDTDLLTTGDWTGRGPFLSLGSSWKSKKAHYPQITMVIGQWQSDSNDFSQNENTNATYVCLNLSYVFVQKSVKILDDLIGGFL